MAINITCDNCETSFQTRNENAGHRVPCHACGASISVRRIKPVSSKKTREAVPVKGLPRSVPRNRFTEKQKLGMVGLGCAVTTVVIVVAVWNQFESPTQVVPPVITAPLNSDESLKDSIAEPGISRRPGEFSKPIMEKLSSFFGKFKGSYYSAQREAEKAESSASKTKESDKT